MYQFLKEMFLFVLITANFACLFIHTLQTKGTTNHSAMPCYETSALSAGGHNLHRKVRFLLSESLLDSV